jgi:hypothetical protein
MSIKFKLINLIKSAPLSLASGEKKYIRQLSVNTELTEQMTKFILKVKFCWQTCPLTICIRQDETDSFLPQMKRDYQILWSRDQEVKLKSDQKHDRIDCKDIRMR